MIISLTEKRKSIIGNSRNWWRSDKKMKSLAKMHGCELGKDGLNEHGVFTKYQKVISFRTSKQTGYAEIFLVKVPAGWWLYDTNIGLHNSYSGGLPSISNRVAFDNLEEATEAACLYIKSRCRDCSSDEISKKVAKQLLQKIDSYLNMEFAQLRLF